MGLDVTGFRDGSMVLASVLFLWTLGVCAIGYKMNSGAEYTKTRLAFYITQFLVTLALVLLIGFSYADYPKIQAVA